MGYWKSLIRRLMVTLTGIVTLVAFSRWIIGLGIFTWAIPDWIFLALIVLILVVTMHTANWVSRYGQGSRSPVIKRSRLRPNMNHMFILSALANSDRQSELRGLLLDGFLRVFIEKETADFNYAFNELKERGYISACGNDPGDDCAITSKGLGFYRENVEDFRESGGVPSLPQDLIESYRRGEDF